MQQKPPLAVVKIMLVNGIGELEGAFEEVTLIIQFNRKNGVGKGAWIGLQVQEAEMLQDAANPESSKMMNFTPRNRLVPACRLDSYSSNSWQRML